MRVVIVGGGIVGLTTGIAFKALGWEVLVCEQAPQIRAAGSALGLWRNALDVWDEFGLGADVRALSTPVDIWFHDADGSRVRASGFDDADLTNQLLPRPQLNALLAKAVGAENIRLDAKVVGFKEALAYVEAQFDDGRTERADLLIGADGVYSAIRDQLLPGFPAQEHAGHVVWRGMTSAEDAPTEGSLLTIGHDGVSGGWSRVEGDRAVWMVNRYPASETAGSKKEAALRLAAKMNDGGWHDRLIRLIEATPEEAILRNQIMFVPELPRWVSARVALIGDAAHGLPPHIGAGGNLGVEDVHVLVRAVQLHNNLRDALSSYEAKRIAHYVRVREFADVIKRSRGAREWAETYAMFIHWMLNDGYRASRD